jgi:hypothetical protein
LYASVLAIFSLAGSQKWSSAVTKHLNLLLTCTSAVYFYRDVFPLGTFTLTPMDLSDGRLLWPKVCTLFIVSVVIPLAMPRQYTPVDPKVRTRAIWGTLLTCIQNPMPETNTEQTASILSLALYSFLDPIIFLGYRIPHLKIEQLPPLCDYDSAENLKARAFPVCATPTSAAFI